MATVNSQISDAVSASMVGVIGSGPSLAMSMTYSAMADAIGMQMHNAVTTQFNAQTIAAASLTQTCALIIASAGGAKG